MAQATTTTVGEIVLSGDLAGSNDAAFPELRASGVVPGHYPLMQRATFDNKGRAVSVGPLDYTSEIAPMLNTATSTINGIFTYGDALKEISGGIRIETASDNVAGIFTTGTGLNLNSETVSININQIVASDSVFGFIKTGAGFTNDSTIGIPNSTTTSRGAFSIGSGLSVSSTVVSLDLANLFASGLAFGFVKTGMGFTNTAGTISIGNASDSVLGLVSVGANITATGNVLSLSTATNNNRGVFSVGTSLNIVNGVVQTAPNLARKNNANIFDKAQYGTKHVANGLTIIPDFVNGPSMTEITLTGSTVIEFPDVLAPTGTMVQQQIVINHSASAQHSVYLSGFYKTNKNIQFSSNGTDTSDVLTLFCTDTMCYAMLNENFL